MDFYLKPYPYTTDSLSSYSAGAEVDLILELEGKIHAIEIKSSEFSKSELSGLNSFQEFIGKPIRKYVVIHDGHSKVIGDVEVLPWQKLIKKILTQIQKS